VPAVVPTPFEGEDLTHTFVKRGAQQDEQSLHRLAPTNHDVTFKVDCGVYVAISLKQ
jgi:hypothetical protein